MGLNTSFSLIKDETCIDAHIAMVAARSSWLRTKIRAARDEALEELPAEESEAVEAAAAPVAHDARELQQRTFGDDEFASIKPMRSLRGNFESWSCTVSA